MEIEQANVSVTVAKVNAARRKLEGFVAGKEEREMLCRIMPKTDRLPYNTEVRVLQGTKYKYEQYVGIPFDEKAAIIRQCWPFDDADKLDMDDAYLDLHTGKKFKLRDAIITRENGRNFVMSPYYSKAEGR